MATKKEDVKVTAKTTATPATKTVEKKTVEAKPVAKKEVVKKEAVKPAAKKAEAKKAETKTTAKKAETKTAAKTATKKATTKKAAAKKENNLFVQFNGMEFNAKNIEETVKADFKAKNGKKTMNSVSIYVKPQDMKAYYVIDGIIGDVAL